MSNKIEGIGNEEMDAIPERRLQSVSENCDLAETVLYGRRLRCFSLTYFLSNTLDRRVSLRPQTPRRRHDRNFQTRSHLFAAGRGRVSEVLGGW